MLGVSETERQDKMADFFQNGIIARLNVSSEATLKGLMVLFVVLCVAVPYVFGSFNTAVFVSKRIYKQDIRECGSGNAGLTNMHRVYGVKAALLVLLGDILKTALSILFAWVLFGAHFGPFGFSMSSFAYLAGLACVVGHIFPIAYGFKGGKGVLCTAAMVLMLSPLAFAVALAVFLLIVFVTRYVSLASMTTGLLYPLILNRITALCGYRMDGIVSIVSVVIGLLILYCHRGNLRRLLDKTEPRFTFRKK